jgi:hypothetical protein
MNNSSGPDERLPIQLMFCPLMAAMPFPTHMPLFLLDFVQNCFADLKGIRY